MVSPERHTSTWSGRAACNARRCRLVIQMMKRHLHTLLVYLGLLWALGWDPGGMITCCVGLSFIGEVITDSVLCASALYGEAWVGKCIRNRAWLRRKRRVRQVLRSSWRVRSGTWGPGLRYKTKVGRRDASRQGSFQRLLRGWLRRGARIACAGQMVGGRRWPMRRLWRRRVQRHGHRGYGLLLQRLMGRGRPFGTSSASGFKALSQAPRNCE